LTHKYNHENLKIMPDEDIQEKIKKRIKAATGIVPDE